MSIPIKCSDGVIISVSPEINIGETFENMKGDTCDDETSEPIEITKITSTTFNWVLEFNRCDFKIPDTTDLWESCDVSEFFKNITFSEIINLTTAADFLNYENLLDCCVRYHAETIKNKSVDEIRELYL